MTIFLSGLQRGLAKLPLSDAGAAGSSLLHQGQPGVAAARRRSFLSLSVCSLQSRRSCGTGRSLCQFSIPDRRKELMRNRCGDRAVGWLSSGSGGPGLALKGQVYWKARSSDPLSPQ